MKCLKCQKKAVIELAHGPLCKSHFLSYMQEKVFKTIKKYNLLERDDTICIAASGGKDSLATLYLIKKYLEHVGADTSKLFALAVDEGIKGYREQTLEDLTKFCQEHEITLHIVSNKEEFGKTLDEAHPIVNKQESKKPCNVCGVWRRYLLNKYARKYGATKVATGHNLDDEAQAILMNLFKANTSLAASLGPISGVSEQEGFVQRIKPLYLCSEKETRLFCLLKGFKLEFTECPYAREGYRAHIRDMLNDFEHQYRGTKHGIVKSYLALLPHLKAAAKSGEVNACAGCGEPSRGEYCGACRIKQVIKENEI